MFEIKYNGILYKAGQPIIGTPKSDYHGLHGVILEIRDGSEKETGYLLLFRSATLPSRNQGSGKTFFGAISNIKKHRGHSLRPRYCGTG